MNGEKGLGMRMRRVKLRRMLEVPNLQSADGQGYSQIRISINVGGMMGKTSRR